jgi:hypothetical protein
MVAVLAEVLAPAPAPRSGVTITGLGIGDSVVTIWQIADGARNAIPGFRRVVMTDAAFVIDYYVPLGRPVSYEVEVLSGPSGPSRTTSDTITVASETGWLMDTLVPQNAVPVVGERRDNGDIYLRGPALAELEYQADVSIIKIMGSKKPMALFGERMAETGLDTSLGTRSAIENAQLKRLLRSTANLHFRPIPGWGAIELDGSLFIANPVVKQTPVNVLMGGNLTWWDMKSDVVAAPTIKVLTATFTYGDVSILFDTYQQKMDALNAAAAAAGEPATYLFDLKHPIG